MRHKGREGRTKTTRYPAKALALCVSAEYFTFRFASTILMPARSVLSSFPWSCFCVARRRASSSASRPSRANVRGEASSDWPGRRRTRPLSRTTGCTQVLGAEGGLRAPLLREAGKVPPKATDGVWSAGTRRRRLGGDGRAMRLRSTQQPTPRPALLCHLVSAKCERVGERAAVASNRPSPLRGEGNVLRVRLAWRPHSPRECPLHA